MASSSSSHNYEVFLSFRGIDTRRNFTDHLYRALDWIGVQTFRDNEELKQGEEIRPELLKAIKESKISIPVFSKNYASSKCCLKELAKIMDCMETDGQVVWPIFYKVEPSDVRNQSGSFAPAFLEHEETQSEETLDEWREALRKAGSLSKWDSDDPKNRCCYAYLRWVFSCYMLAFMQRRVASMCQQVIVPSIGSALKSFILYSTWWARNCNSSQSRYQRKDFEDTIS